MGRQFSNDLKFRIISLRSKGFRISSIVKRFAEEGIHVNRTSVSDIVKKFKKGKSIANRRRPGRKSKFNFAHFDLIDNSLEDNDELTANDLQRMLTKQFDLNVSVSAIKKIRRKLGWVITGPRYCQAIRKMNCEKRLEFVKKCWNEKEQFNDVIFTDESSIIIDRHSRVCFRKVGSLPRFKPKVKHPVKVSQMNESQFFKNFDRVVTVQPLPCTRV